MKTPNLIRSCLFVTGLALAACQNVEAQYGAHYGRYYAGNYSRVVGRRYYRLGGPYLSIGFGGSSYAYYGGAFYRPYGGYFRLVAPPFGISIGMLPYGYSTIYAGPDPYYYYNGIYYRPYEGGYQVTPPPLGATVPELPAGAKPRVINGQKYYELNGTYYSEQINSKNELSYTVVGRNGVLDTNKNEPQNEAEGDVVGQLPENSKTVVINGKKYYVSPAGNYYQELINGDKVEYEIVGKASEKR